MRHSSAIPVFTAFVSLALGAALYYVFLHTAPDLLTSGTRTQAEQTPADQNQGESAGKKPFSFNAYSKPRDLPEVAFTAEDGRPLTLEAFRGKYVLLNIWATWCGPCREEMPALDRLQAKLGGPKFLVLPLSIDREGAAVVKDFYEELKLTSLDIYVDETVSAPATLNVIGIPATLFINPQGKEIGRLLGPAEWDSPDVIEEIQRYLDKLK